MKVIGLFREIGADIDNSAPSIHDVVGQLTEDEKTAVLGYLDSGVPVLDVMQTTIDPLNKAARVSGGPSLLSDGDWIWRLDLGHFVKNYRVGLPKEFVALAVSKKMAGQVDESAVLSKCNEILSAYNLARKGEV